MDLTDIALLVIAAGVVAFIVVRIVRIFRGRGGCGCGSCASGAPLRGNAPRQSGSGESETHEVQLLVANMHCTRCEKSIVMVLSKIEGIESVKPDHHTGVVSIHYRGVEALEAAKAMLGEIGFAVQSQES